MSRALLKKSLDVLTCSYTNDDEMNAWHKQCMDVIAEIREALAATQPAQQEPVALFEWLPEGATHIGRISVRTEASGSLAMTTRAFKYDSAVLKVYVTDNDNEYPGWRDAKDCFFHLNFPVLPLYTSPQPAQRTWVGLTDDQRIRLASPELFMYLTEKQKQDFVVYARDIEAKLKEKNT